MLIYFILLGLCCALWYWNKKQPSKKTSYLSLAVLFLAVVTLMTLRFDIGFDYWSYDTIYKECAANPFTQTMQTHWKEPLFFLITTAFAKMGLSYHVFLLFCNLIMVGCVFYVAYRHSKNWCLSIFLYITLHFLAHSMNFLRQSLAASIAFLGWKYLKEGSFIKYTLVILLAATFHVSVLILIPAYFLLRLPFNRIALPIIGGAALAGYLLFNPLIKFAAQLNLPYLSYLDTLYAQGSSFSFAIFPIILLLFALCFYKQLLEKDATNSILLYAMIYNAIIYIFVTKMYIIERFSVYFFLYILLLLPEIIALYDEEPEVVSAKKSAANRIEKSYHRQKKDTQIVVTFCILVGCFGYFLFGARNGYHKAYPYVSIWEPEKIISNEEYLFQSSHL